MIQDVQATMNTLRTATMEILNLDVHSLSFEELYRMAYDLVLSKEGDRLFTMIDDCVTDHLCLHVASKIADIVGEVEFLMDFEARYQRHCQGVEMLTDVFAYLDRVHVERSKSHQHSIRQMAMERWLLCVVKNPRISRRLGKCLSDLVRREREKDVELSRDVLRKVSTMLFELQEDSAYVLEFESRLLDDTTSFYKAMAEKHIVSDDCPTYLKMVENQLEAEKKRCAAYMQERTHKALFNRARDELLTNVSDTLLLHNTASGFIEMLRSNQLEHLSRFYKLFLTMDGLAGMPDVFYNHLKETGKALVKNAENAWNPMKFVEDLFVFKEKYDIILSKAFDNNRLLESQCNQAYQLVANFNPRTAEFLSLYLDHVLRKPAKDATDDDLDVIFNKAMGIFRLFNEKDVFETYYRRHLSKRLLNKRSASDDSERAFVAKLRNDCGLTYTVKLEGMFNDMLNSVDLHEAFRASHPDLLDVNVTVLTTGSWPMKEQSKTIILPPACERVCYNFDKFYHALHSGRKLTWQTSMGTADIKATFPSGEYEITVSTLHMCVLMLFNTHDELTTDNIADMINVEPEQLMLSLQALACVKGKNILTKYPTSKDVSMDDVFSVNSSFSSKSHKVKIASISQKRETDEETTATRHKISDDRKPQIEATIVRIMKSHKRLDHNSIVVEVNAELRNRFLPTPAEIKKHIENLIEREFIERDPNDRKMYVYLA